MRAYGVEIANFKLMVCSTIFRCILFPCISFHSLFVLLFHLVNVASLNFQKKKKRKFKRNLKHIIWVPDLKIMIYARCSLLINSNEKFFLSLDRSPNKAKNIYRSKMKHLRMMIAVINLKLFQTFYCKTLKTFLL